MSKIKVLPPEIYNKIAAGEVVERPSSIVKELVENSIDAGSTKITIEIEDGGTSLIRIIDNGHGIYKNDIKNAFLNHATSKISSIEDVYKIQSLGFRGEALSSISSISKVDLRSINKDEGIPTRFSIEGGKETFFGDAAINEGTIIEIRDIFYNVPARLKFLKTNQREAAIISELVTKLILSHPSIGFSFYNNNKKIIETFEGGSLTDVIKIVYGNTIFENLIEIEGANKTAKLKGYIGNLKITKNNRNFQSLFVNGRFIKSKTVIASIDNAYKSFLTVNKHPFYIIFLEIDEKQIDVNIHPQKSEIKFEFEREIFSLFFNAVHNGLKKDLEGSFNIENENMFETNKSEIFNAIKFEPLTYFDHADEKRKTEDFDTLKETPLNIEELSIENFTQNSFGNEDINTIKEEIKPEKTQYMQKENDIVSSVKVEEYNKIEKEIDFEIQAPKKVINEFSRKKFREITYIGQYSNTYIIAEDKILDELYIIDQHAAHEKILFEKYYEAVKTSNIDRQVMLSPEVIHLTLKENMIYQEFKEEFNNFGYTIEDFGDNSIRILEVPYILGKVDVRNLFSEILESFEKYSKADVADIRYNKIASKSCKAAIKANKNLKEIEVYSLINELSYLENPFTCPHGRPVIIKISKNEIEKMFKRIQ